MISISTLSKRSFSKSTILKGWNQYVMFGYGVPLPAKYYKTIRPLVNDLTTVKLKELAIKYENDFDTVDTVDTHEQSPVIISGKDRINRIGGFVLFSPHAKLSRTGWLINNDILGAFDSTDDENYVFDFYNGHEWEKTSESDNKQLSDILMKIGINNEITHGDIFHDEIRYNSYSEWLTIYKRNRVKTTIVDSIGLYAQGINYLEE
jgi:hypothetical protein